MKRLLAALAVLMAGLCPGQETNSAALVEEARHLCAYAPVDFPRAAELLRRAEAEGNADATAHLGLLYAGGEGVPYDPEHARELYRAAADRGSFVGRLLAAVSLLFGPDAADGIAELSKLADSDDRSAWVACQALSTHFGFRAARSLPANGGDTALAALWRSRALVLLEPLARAGDPDARVAYGSFLLYPAPGVDRDAFRAGAEASREWFLPEAERGSLNAMQALVVSYDTNIFPRPFFQPDDPAADAADAAQRDRWCGELRAALERAVDQGSVAHAVSLARLLSDDDCGPTDPARAAELFRRSADAGHPFAALYLARFLERVTGVAKDEAAAEARYRAVLAANPIDAGIARPEAAQRLARLLLRRGPDGRPEAKRLLNLARKEPANFGNVATHALRTWKQDGPDAALSILDHFYPDTER